MPYKDLEKRRAYAREYHSKYYPKHADERIEYRKTRRAEDRSIWARWWSKKKILVLSHYGVSGKPICVKCGFTDMRALSLDHKDGNGAEHKRLIGKNVYLWLINNNFPEGYQTLCMNCQFIKRDENHELWKS